MADVRGASGIPPAAAFGIANTPTPATPIYVDSANGDAYVFIGGVVKKIAAVGAASGLTATGTTQGTALELTSTVNYVSTVAADTGVKLNSAQVAGSPAQIVYNGGANPLKVYPHSGGKINQVATNTAILLATQTLAQFWLATSTQWVGSLSA